jgi:hypothetical protein
LIFKVVGEGIAKEGEQKELKESNYKNQDSLAS